jgi:predicted rRNA methylase YqxC with S4 and FtsJ domains
LAIEVHIAHVVAIDVVADHLVASLDVTAEVVLGFVLDASDVEVASEAVLDIGESDLA